MAGYQDLRMFMESKELRPTWLVIKNYSPEERVKTLYQVFLDLAESHLDESSALLWETLMHALNDCELQPIMREAEELGTQSHPGADRLSGRSRSYRGARCKQKTPGFLGAGNKFGNSRI